jgi:peptide/nickel transport system ATP-binding protein
MTDVLLEVKELQTSFFTPEGEVKAVNGVTFSVRRGSTVGVVGESGCGKSVTAFSILKLVTRPGKIVGGSVWLHTVDEPAVDLVQLPENSQAMRAIRGNQIAMIFQEPMNALSPVHTIGNQIVEAIRLHRPLSKSDAEKEALELLHLVGVPRPEIIIKSYVFQLSGGMRQRAMIAMAFACRPALLIADEPTTALDVTTQAQILELIASLQAQLHMAVLLITHDLGVVAETCDEVVVMYLGEVVEQARVEALFDNPLHPYTQALLRSIPRLGAGRTIPLNPIEGNVPDPFNRPQGCPFHPRCSQRIVGRCDHEHPELTPLSDGRVVRCWLYSAEQREESHDTPA